MSYCLYLRKSRSDMEAESHGEGETLARHEKLLLELARRGNYNVTQIYREVVSGETLVARPVMQQLLSEVEQGLWEGVLVVEVERLARGDTIDQGIVAQAFKYSDTKIVTPTKVYDPNNEFDEEYFEFGLFMSRREYKTINRRLQRGRLAASKEGKHVGGSKPYGYVRKKIENDKGWTLAIDEEQADIVRLIFRLYTTPEESEDGSLRHIGIHDIARRLDALGIPAPGGGNEWSVSTIHNMLLNPVYIGKIRWQHKKSKKVVEGGSVSVKRYISPPGEELVFDGLHPPIVSEELFNKAAEIMTANPPAVRGEQSLVNPLAGLLRCGRCGRNMAYRSSPNYPSVRCLSRHCHVPGSNLLLVEARVLEALSGWLSSYRLEWSSEPSPSDASRIEQAEKALRRSESEVKRLRDMLSRTHELLEQGVYDTDTFLERSRLLSEQISAAEATVSRCSSELASERRREENKRNIVPKVERLLEVYSSLPSAQAKNDMLKEVLEKVEYFREKRAVKGGHMDEFEIVLYPKLPPAEN
ncbi:DNA invertase Pin-like site-specific DNA recombinase [Fusobacterium naviforme]|nr:recombinase family protein [Fusobacterium naviforme]PSL10231.1 DNA invertase Pin-like site-specific DNA recombinase [Fusobacterium naviforme]STO27641.1 Recombinase [Fusobacterium naviforme]